MNACNLPSRSAVLATLLSLIPPLHAQWTLPDVLQRASAHYAGTRIPIEQAASAAAAVQLARNAFLPKGDLYAQINRATRNNVFGMMLPNPVIPSISGPPQTANAGTNVWGSATGFLIQWEPFDFGQRQAHVSTADAARQRAQLTSARTRFEVDAAAADAFLTVLAADQTVAAARAAVERARSLATLAAAQAQAGLRPEADSSRAKAELALAQGQLIQANQAARLARIALAQFTGDNWQAVQPQAPFTTQTPIDPTTAAGPHPAMQEQQAAVHEAEARQHEAAIAWRPRFNTQSALYARGAGDADQIGPHFYNWGIGFSVLFPFLDLPSIRAQQQIQAHNTLAEQNRLAKLNTDLQTQTERAKANLDAARNIAETTPIQLEAATAAQAQARARYQAGLATFAEVSDAQRLLLQTEIDHSLARLNIWRAYLSLATAQGDLQPFLQMAHQEPRP
ncbi:MAG: TolC family protein [Acidobacteria bacterium]|nr:TolC family protein [Acidobacteriota bacterium]